MPIIIGIFCALPFLAGLIAEYLVCRLTRRRWWKLLPPAAAVALTAAVAVGRAGVWESDQSPLTQLLFVCRDCRRCLPCWACWRAGGCGNGCGARGW